MSGKSKPNDASARAPIRAKCAKEWKRLQRRGGSNRIDHPGGPGEGKDIFDAESIAIWCAATSGCAKLSVTWA